MNNIQMMQFDEEQKHQSSNQRNTNKQIQSSEEDIVFKLNEFQPQTPRLLMKRIQKMTIQQIFEKNDRQGRLKTFKREIEIRNTNKLQKLKIVNPSEQFSKKTIITIISTIFQATMAFLASILYIVNTYYVEDKDTEPTFVFLETTIGIIFLSDYIWNFYHSSNKNLSSEETLFLAGFVGIVRVTRIFRVFRIYKLFKEYQEQNYSLREYWEVKRKQLVIISQLFVSLLVSAGLIQAFHEFDFGFQIGPREKLTFDAALYYITVTCTTVGYGDLTPDNELSQIIVLLFIVSIIFIITNTTTQFNELSNITSKYKLPYEGHQKKHILLIGNVNPDNFITFAKEFYHPDICKDIDTPILIMLEQEPNDDWKSIFKSSQFMGKIYYIVGNPLKKSDLQLAKLSSNKVMILIDQFSQESSKEDVFALLATQIISDQYPRCQIFTQVNSKENLFWNFWHGQRSIVSANLLKMGTISQNVFIPGFSTLISNLSMSLSSENHLVGDYSPWKLEYIQGMSNDIHIFDFKEDKQSQYVTKTFQQACLEIYNKTGILMIAFKRAFIFVNKVSRESDHFDIVINPIDYIINHEDCAILLAKNQLHCYQIFQNQQNELGGMREQEQYVPTYHQIYGTIESSQISHHSEGKLQQTFFKMSKVDMRKKIINHIIILGELGYVEQLIEELRTRTELTICYVSKNSPDDNWDMIKKRFSKLYYFQCQYFNIDELERTAIRNSFHTIIMCGPEGSEFQDSKILPIANMITENFSEINYTIELRREKNVKYIINKALDGIIDDKKQTFVTQNCYTNPLFASSKLFYTAQLSYSMARTLHFEDFGEILEKLISPHLYPNLSNITENNQFSYVEIPYTLSNLYTYQQVFDYFIRNNIIPIALYRKANSLDNEEDFLYTNPNPQAPILKGDLLVVIGNTKYHNGEPIQSENEMNKEEKQIEEITISTQTSENENINKQIEKIKLGLVGLLPELSVFGEDRDSNDQKGLARIENISKTLIELNSKFNIQNESRKQQICEYLKTNPDQIQQLLEMNKQLLKLIDENEKLRYELGKEVNIKVVASHKQQINTIPNKELVTESN